MAKRKKAPDPHTELVGVRYTPDQRKALEEQAKPIPLSTYIRHLTLKRSQPQSVPTINLETYQELQKMSISLTQINESFSTVINRGEVLEGEHIRDWLSTLQDVKAELKRIGMNAIAAIPETVEVEETDENEFTL